MSVYQMLVIAFIGLAAAYVSVILAPKRSSQRMEQVLHVTYLCALGLAVGMLIGVLSNIESRLTAIEVMLKPLVTFTEPGEAVESADEPKVDPKKSDPGPKSKAQGPKAKESSLKILTNAVYKRYQSSVDYQTAREIAAAALRYEDREFPSRWDILSVVAIETAFKCSRVSSVGAKGCMQINPVAWPSVPREDLSSVDKSIMHGAQVLRHFYDRTGRDKKKALLAYNAGYRALQEGRVLHKYYTRFEEEHQALKSASKF